MIIREFKENDKNELMRIYAQGVEAGKSTFQTEIPSFEQWDKAHCKHCRFVAELDGKVVGWCAVSPTSSRAAYSGVVEVSVYVDADCHGRGVGTALLERLISECGDNGIWCLYSAIFEINTASLRLHEKCGFRRIGYRERIARDRFGNWQNTVLFEKRL